MSDQDELIDFKNNHPWPERDRIESLFRFSSVNRNKIEYLRHLLVEGRLYHATPDQFNDPFECRPHFNWPSDPKKVAGIRKHLIRMFVKRGHKRKEAESLVAKSMRKPGYINRSIYNSAIKAFNKTRICSFTTSKDNLLFWSHYADAHRGFCLEFDSTKLPISYAYKVHYSDRYPEVEYPAPGDYRGLKPALVKSTVWTYENEYRTVFVPEAKSQPKNDGSSLILSGMEIKRVYFGAKISKDDRALLIDMIGEGPFSPQLWTTTLSKTEYGLVFDPF